MRRIPLVLAVTALTVALAACGPGAEPTTPTPDVTVAGPSSTPTPTPTPAPTAPPEVGDLVISSEGLGPMLLGEAPDPDPTTAMIFEDDAACVDAGATPGTAEAVRWRAIPLYTGPEYTLFGVAVADGVVQRVDIFDDTIPTDAGIRIGDARSDVLTAYPDASVIENQLTDVVVVTGDRGTLQIEVATEDSYWSAGAADRVQYIHAAIPSLGAFTVVASENVAGGCL